MKKVVLRITITITVLATILALFTACGGKKPTLNGIDIENYTIVYDADTLDYNKRAAEYIRDFIKEKARVELSLIEDGEAKREYEIVVGETNREISALLDEETEGTEFAILSNDGSVALEGNYFVIAAAAYYFANTYVTYGTTVPEVAEIHTPIVKEAKSFILLIGDGMGALHTNLFEKYDVATEGELAYSDGEDLFYGYLLPYYGSVKTSSLDGITDSAASGTALSTGYKTHNRYIGKDGNGNDVQSITELLGSRGMATAVMSTEAQNGATPSTFYAHTLDRDNTTELTESRIQTTKKYGTVISCSFNYYTQSKIQTIEKKITDVLDEVGKDRDGFFLMYEEAYIDKHASAGDMDMTFNALVRFNQAIGRFMEYAFYHPDTMVIITADHETGGLSVDESGEWSFTTDEHTSANVPFFAWGGGADVFNGCEIENSQIPKTIARMKGVKNFGDQSAYPALTN